MMVFINKFIFIALVFTSGFFYSLLLFLSDYKENKCEMTYMFQYPQFVRISMTVDKHFKKYGLYSYSEGQFTEKARKMHFDGIPVLFIPGNAGSHKQVRSFASVALRKALNSRSSFHFDYFTIDFNEELSGFNGALLYDQVEYVKQCIHRILELYPQEKIHLRPTSVILIGHSMGGIIAEGVLNSMPDNIISLIITLATPYKRVPLMFDTYLHAFYNDISQVQNNSSTTFINIFGGFNDFLVSPHLTMHKDFNVATTHIPKTWLPVDHLCILWCKQLVLVVNRALFESIDLKTKQISDDKEYVKDVFKHHLIHNSGIKTNTKKQYSLPTDIDNTGAWIEYLPRQYTVDLSKGTKETQWYMIRLVKHMKHEVLSLMAINFEFTNWVYVCTADTVRGQSRVCIDGLHLSHLSEIVPSPPKIKRRFLNINLHNLQPNFTHIVTRIPPTSSSIALYVDVYGDGERKLTVDLPTWSMKSKTIIDETAEEGIYYELHFPNLNTVLQSYYLYVEPKQCKVHNYHVVASLTVPWANHDYYTIFTEKEKKPMELRLYSKKPADMTNSSAYVRLMLDPNCRYSVSVKVALSNVLAQFSRFYSPLIFPYVIIIVLLSFKSQLKNIEKNGRCSLFFTSLMSDTKPYYVLPVARISSLLLSRTAFVKYLPVPDIFVLEEEGVDIKILIASYVLSVGIVWILAMTLSIIIFCFDSTIQKLALKILSKSITGTPMSYDWILKGLKKFPCFVAFVLISLCLSTCGGLALCVGLVFYFLKLTQMASDVVEDIVKKCITAFTRKFNLRRRLPQNIQSSGNTENNTITKRIKRFLMEKVLFFIKKDRSTPNTNEVREEPTNGDASVDNTAIPTVTEDTTNTNEDNEPISFAVILQEIAENNELYFHFTLFSLWFLITCINVPVVLTWAHSFKFNTQLENDPSFIPAIIVCACALALWQLELPKTEKKWYIELSYVIYGLTIISAIYGVVSIFRINYVLSIVIALVTLHQLLAPNKPQIEEDDEAAMIDDQLEKIKAKMD